jgi:hypothetical protein
MSIGSITALAVARNTRRPTKSDAGEVTEESVESEAPPSLMALLIKQVPVSMVAGYTALTAGLVELVGKATRENPQPDQLLPYRWAGFAILVLFSMALTYLTYRAKADEGARRPVAEVLGVGVAAAGWGLGIPESPLLAQLSGPQGAAMVLLIGFAAVAANLVIASRLTTQVVETPSATGQVAST